MLKLTGLGDYFKDHLCYGDTLQPKAYTIDKIINRNNLTEAIYIGDTIGDMEACEEIDIPFIYAAYGFGNLENMTWEIHSPTQLVSTINTIWKK
jgi:phosphoglycolate phosphatase